jgi:hypothetical protein
MLLSAALQQLAALLDVEFVAAELAQACLAAQLGFVGPVALDLACRASRWVAQASAPAMPQSSSRWRGQGQSGSRGCSASWRVLPYDLDRELLRLGRFVSAVAATQCCPVRCRRALLHGDGHAGWLCRASTKLSKRPSLRGSVWDRVIAPRTMVTSRFSSFGRGRKAPGFSIQCFPA